MSNTKDHNINKIEQYFIKVENNRKVQEKINNLKPFYLKEIVKIF